jgi:hypothetical protein
VKPILVVLLVAFALPVHAGGNVVTTLERGTRLAKNARGHELWIQGKKITVTLRRDGGIDNAGVIGVNRTFSQHGYFLDVDGKLSPADNKALGAELAADGGFSRENVVRSVRAGVSAMRAETRRLATADRWIDSTLRTLTGKPRVLASNRRAEISYERSGAGEPMLVLTKGYSQHAIFLSGDAERGYTIHPADRAEIAAAYLAK